MIMKEIYLSGKAVISGKNKVKQADCHKWVVLVPFSATRSTAFA